MPFSEQPAELLKHGMQALVCLPDYLNLCVRPWVLISHRLTPVIVQVGSDM
jgi:hypothetical protein